MKIDQSLQADVIYTELVKRARQYRIVYPMTQEELADKARKAMQESGLPVGKSVTECFIPKADFYAFSANKIQ